MNYQSLSPSLHSIADRALKYFKKTLGVSSFGAEIAIDPGIQYCPTLSATSSDHHYLCVEVVESAYSDALDSFVVDCMQKAFPVRLYLAIPNGMPPANFRTLLSRAKRRGVGIVEIGAGSEEMHCEPLSLSLAALRPIALEEFPPKMRQALTSAETTFRNGNPSKGCSDLFDELESYSRKLAFFMHTKSFWNGPVSGANFQKDAWANIIRTTARNADWAKIRADCPDFNAVAFEGLIGLTAPRNDSGHKPATTKKLIDRDRRLRTRFEHISDVLSELVSGTRKLKL